MLVEIRSVAVTEDGIALNSLSVYTSLRSFVSVFFFLCEAKVVGCDRRPSALSSPGIYKG